MLPQNGHRNGLTSICMCCDRVGFDVLTHWIRVPASLLIIVVLFEFKIFFRLGFHVKIKVLMYFVQPT